MSERINSTKLRRLVFERDKREHPVTGRVVLYCGECDVDLDPVRSDWHVDHKIALAISGNNDLENLQVICIRCHSAKTKADVKAIAKGKRVSDKHYGIKRPKRIMPGSRGHYLKKKLDGSVVRRDSE